MDFVFLSPGNTAKTPLLVNICAADFSIDLYSQLNINDVCS